MATIVHVQNRLWKPLCGISEGAVSKQPELVTCLECEKKLNQLICDDKVAVEMGAVHWPVKK